MTTGAHCPVTGKPCGRPKGHRVEICENGHARQLGLCSRCVNTCFLDMGAGCQSVANPRQALNLMQHHAEARLDPATEIVEGINAEEEELRRHLSDRNFLAAKLLLLRIERGNRPQ